MKWEDKVNPDGVKIVKNEPSTITALFFEDG